MKIKFDSNFLYLLRNQISYIAKDKPLASKKFQKDLIYSLKKDLKYPYNFKKSVYFDDDMIRDYTFKGYTIVFFINLEKNQVEIFEFIKYMEKL